VLPFYFSGACKKIAYIHRESEREKEREREREREKESRLLNPFSLPVSRSCEAPPSHFRAAIECTLHSPGIMPTVLNRDDCGTARIDGGRDISIFRDSRDREISEAPPLISLVNSEPLNFPNRESGTSGQNIIQREPSDEETRDASGRRRRCEVYGATFHGATKRTVKRASSFLLDHSFLHDSIKENALRFLSSSLKPTRGCARINIARSQFTSHLPSESTRNK